MSLPSSGWSSRPWRFTTRGFRPARALQRAVRIALRTTVAARVHHPHVTQRKVVANRICWINSAQRASDLCRHLPAGAHVPRQPQAVTETDDVRIERHDQPRRAYLRPDAKID